MSRHPAPPPPDRRWLVLILVGGMLGTGLRAWLSGTYAAADGTWPWPTFWINVTGSFLLGLLLEALALTGPDAGWRRGARLGIGTGVLGGFTTYSTFSVETVELLRGGHWMIAAGYALSSVVLGIVAAVLGLRLGRTLFRDARRVVA